MDETKYPQLKTELTIDPLVFGYAGMTDVQMADALNAVGTLNQKKDRTDIPTWRLLTAVDDVEFALLTATQLSMFQAICSCVQVDISNGRVRAMLQRIFMVSPLTKANLVLLAREPAARWETLNLGGPVVYWDVERARALP